MDNNEALASKLLHLRELLGEVLSPWATAPHKRWGMLYVVDRNYPESVELFDAAEDDANLIVALFNEAPGLLDTIDRLQAENEKLWALIDESDKELQGRDR